MAMDELEITCKTRVVMKWEHFLANFLDTQGGDAIVTALINSGCISSSWLALSSLSMKANNAAVAPPKECPTSRNSYPCHQVTQNPHNQ